MPTPPALAAISTDALLALVAAGLLAVGLLLWRLLAAVENLDGGAADALETDAVETAVRRSLSDVGLRESITRIEDHAADIADAHDDVESMLRAPQARGAFGERQLEVILADHLPPESFDTQAEVLEGKRPDATVETSAGLLPVDAKFPLESYRRYVEASDDAAAQRHRRQFASDVEGHLEAVADYVRPDAGTTDFAFAFVPSESVYHHLVTEEYDLLREFSTRGVQVVSPLTLAGKLELVRADLHATRLSEEAEQVARRLATLEERFAGLEDEWATLRRHVRNAHSKAEAVDRSYDRLRDAFDRVADVDLEATAGADAVADPPEPDDGARED